MGLFKKKSDERFDCTPELGETEKRSFKDKVVGAFDDKMEDIFADATMRARVSKMDRWAELSGTDDRSKIDYSNPYVSLEYFLCDFKIQLMLADKDQRNDALLQMSELQRQVYLTCKQPNGEDTYWEGMESQSLTKALLPKLRRKKKKSI